MADVAEWIKQGGLAALAGVMTYFFIMERIARDKERAATDTARETERTACTTRYDTLLAMLLKMVPDSIKSDNENVAALRGVEAGLGALKASQERIERKVGA